MCNKKYYSTTINNTLGKTLLLLVLHSVMLFTVLADVDSETTFLKIQSQSLETALQTFAEQVEKQIIFYSADTVGFSTDGFEGHYSEPQALEILLETSNLEYIYLNERTIGIRKKSVILTDQVSKLDNKTANKNLPKTNSHLVTQAPNNRTNTIDEILVVGRQLDQQLAISEKRNANQIIDVITADQSSRLPDNNIAESLSRLPGITFLHDAETGNGNFISIRGIDSALNKIQFDGVNLGLSTGNSERRVPLSGLISDNISELKVVKSLLPQDDGEGIGGFVQITSKTPLQESREKFTVDLEKRDFEFANKSGFRTSASGTKFFGENIGISFATSFRRRDIKNFRVDATGSNILQLPDIRNAMGEIVSLDDIQDLLGNPGSSFDRVPRGFFELSNIGFEEYSYGVNDQTRDTLFVSGAFDWRISDNTLLTLNGRFDQQDIKAQENTFSFDTDEDEFVERDGVLITNFDDAELDLESQIEDEANINASVYLKGVTEFDNLKLDYQLSFSRASRDAPQTQLDFDTGNLLNIDGFSFNNFIFENTYFPIPNPRVLDNSIYVNAIEDLENSLLVDDFEVRLKDQSQNNRYALTFNAENNISKKFWTGTINTLTFGTKFERSNISEDGLNFSSSGGRAINLDGSYVLNNQGTANQAFLSQFNGLLGAPQSLSSIGSPLSRINLNSIPVLDVDNFRQLSSNFRESFLVSEDFAEEVDTTFFDAREDLLAAYLQAEFEFGKLTLHGGARIEYYTGEFTNSLDFDSAIFTEEINDRDDESELASSARINLGLNSQLESVTTQSSNFEILPRLNANYAVNDKFQIRAALGKSIARPSFNQLSQETTSQIRLFLETDPLTGQSIFSGVTTAADALAIGGLTQNDISDLFISQSSGNSSLKNAEAYNIDLSFEYYPFDGTSFALGLFYKDIDNFIFIGEEPQIGSLDTGLTRDLLSNEGRMLIDQLGGLQSLVDSGLGEVELLQPTNGDKAIVKGLELGINHQFHWAPGFFSRLGFTANATFTDSRTSFQYVPELNSRDAQVVLGFSNAGDELRRTSSFFNSPDLSSNFILFYDYQNLEIALSGRYQSESFNSIDDFGLDQYDGEFKQFDFYIEYALPPNNFTDLSIYFEVPDFTDTGTKPIQFQTLGPTNQVFDDLSFNGREFRLGIRGKF